jgi:hypothetical protein
VADFPVARLAPSRSLWQRYDSHGFDGYDCNGDGDFFGDAISMCRAFSFGNAT